MRNLYQNIRRRTKTLAFCRSSDSFLGAFSIQVSLCIITSCFDEEGQVDLGIRGNKVQGFADPVWSDEDRFPSPEIAHLPLLPGPR